MSTLDQPQDESGQARVLGYGRPLMRKTTWLFRAAEAGFNVIYLDFEGQFQVSSQLSDAAKSRIFRINCSPNPESFANCGLYMVLRAMAGETLLYDTAGRKYVSGAQVDAEKQYVAVDLTKASFADIVGIDSWSAMVEQMEQISQAATDPANVSKLEWDAIAKNRHAMNTFVSNMKKLRTHFIVTGHSETYGKKRLDAAASEKPETAIQSVRTQPFSVSRAHGELVAKGFTDVLRFTKSSDLGGVIISTKGSDDVDAGSRTLAPANYKFDDVNFEDFVQPEHRVLAAQNGGFSSNAVKTVLGADFIAQRKAKPATGISVGKVSTILKR